MYGQIFNSYILMDKRVVPPNMSQKMFCIKNRSFLGQLLIVIDGLLAKMSNVMSIVTHFDVNLIFFHGHNANVPGEEKGAGEKDSG